jgi:pyruvate/2-oxoglutarate dehydrogenase complex dihydrolipoamide acyltransferase (E2) component
VTTPDERLDYADRWMRDSLDILRAPFTAYEISADMTNALVRLDAFRQAGTAVSVTHLLVYAAAQALASNPGLHMLIAGNRRHRPTQVDIGLSVTGETFVAPVLIVEAADRKSVTDIADEVTRRVPEVRDADRQMLNHLRRWGRLVPFAPIRRAILRRLFSATAYRRKVAGTFQISTVPTDRAFTSTFVAAGVLVAGPVLPRVVPVEGQAVVRPTMSLTLSGDHGVWDGRAAARLLSAIKRELEAAA